MNDKRSKSRREKRARQQEDEQIGAMMKKIKKALEEWEEAVCVLQSPSLGLQADIEAFVAFLQSTTLPTSLTPQVPPLATDDKTTLSPQDERSYSEVLSPPVRKAPSRSSSRTHMTPPNSSRDEEGTGEESARGKRSSRKRTSHTSDSSGEPQQDTSTAVHDKPQEAVPSEAPSNGGEDLANLLSFDLDGLDSAALDSFGPPASAPSSGPSEIQFDLSGLGSLDEALGPLPNGPHSAGRPSQDDFLSFDLSGIDDAAAGLGSMDTSSSTHKAKKQKAQSLSRRKKRKIAPLMATDHAPPPMSKGKTTTGSGAAGGGVPLSYDDFMAALSGATQSEAPPPPERGDGVLRMIGMREDMNRRGMKKIKKKSVTTGLRQKGVYQMEDTSVMAYPFEGDSTLALLGIFDGHSGKDAATECQTVFPEIFGAYVKKKKKKLRADLKLFLQKLFLEADQRLMTYETEGTTATVTLLWCKGEQRYIQSANVGDSSVFLIRGGRAIPLSVDHKVDHPDEVERMKAAGMTLNKGQNRINGLALCRTLGDHFIKQNFPGVTADPFVSPVYALTEEDTHVIMASDGLWDVMTGQEAYDLTQHLTSPQDMANKLMNAALSSGKCTDNVTIIVALL